MGNQDKEAYKMFIVYFDRKNVTFLKIDQNLTKYPPYTFQCF